uniref:SCP domain-containing protein n=1 Tax=Globodera pallida TaxID=36090 RepID=A0A183BK50_GLOPA
MRRLFGHSKSPPSLGENAKTGKESVPNGKQRKSVGIHFLRKSQSTQERKKGGDQRDGSLGGPSRTFDDADVAKSQHSTDFLSPTSNLVTSHSDSHILRDIHAPMLMDANFQRQCLQAHNYVRQVYSSPPLLWSQELAGLAKTWALKLADRGAVLYPELPGIGENIFLLAGKSGGRSPSPSPLPPNCPPAIGDHLTTGIELVALWASEAQKVDFERPRWTNETKHFTQMVWRSALEMGVARHWNTSKDCLSIVAFYRPAGNSNLPGEFSANLPSAIEASAEALQAVTLAALIQALNRNDLGDGGFRKGPLPPVARPFAGPPNTTKILKSSAGPGN